MRQKTTQLVQGFFSAVLNCLLLSWKASRLYTVLRLTFSLLSPILVLLEALFGKCILDLLTGDLDPLAAETNLFFLAFGLMIVILISSLLQKAQLYMQVMHDDMINRELALYMMDKAGTADIEYFDNTDYYDKLTACSRDAPMIANLVWNTLSAISAIFSIVISFTALSKLKVIYGIFVILSAGPASVVGAKYTKAIYSLSLDQINGERQKNYLQGLLLDKRFIQDLRLFNGYGRIKQKYQHLWESLFKKRKEINRRRSIITGLFECVPIIIIAVIGIDIARCVLAGTATVGDYSLYTGLLSKLWSSEFLLSSAIMQIYDNQLKMTNLRSLEKYQNHVIDAGTKTLGHIDTIKFDHVSFSYPGTNKVVLQDVSFCIGKGEKVALVGLNGSGKSTLIKLLLRLYEVDKGTIQINGIDIRQYKLWDLRRNFSAYFQDAPNYSFDLRENIVIADADRPSSDEDVIHAINDSGAGEILKLAPLGLDTLLTRLFDHQGMELSGGQHQKLALARTFYRRHSALILDEPSSSLDPRAEHLLFGRLKAFTQGKTVLFTSHRLANVILADRIVVLENGSVLEEGTQKELLEQDGRYAELYRYQQEHYRE